MHNTRTIFLREIRSFFNSPMAYIFLVIFAIFNGYFFTSTFFLYNQSDLRSLFSVVPMVYLIFVPAISMGLIAREKNIGTMETIATLPLKTYEFVLGHDNLIEMYDNGASSGIRVTGCESVPMDILYVIWIQTNLGWLLTPL